MTPDELLLSTLMLAIEAMFGAVVSCTVTRNAALFVLELESVAEQLTVVVPNGKPEPEMGEQFTATEPSAVSIAEAE